MFHLPAAPLNRGIYLGLPDWNPYTPAVLASETACSTSPNLTFGKVLLRATLGQPLTIRLRQPACCVHQGRSSTHQFSARPEYRQMDLRLRTAMPHRPQ